ncbi:MAG TPA: bifunctional methylenetetrahydrofolate dehydrogenase/methenyltetrahydrofolate cyclohydrolase FolD [Syntrophales bacterium]|nr:bifunctional methylenetetrahydrofolate dehydrogenase/methenyltetrahydrofolate cyclohydrolase FolD [Syntrophales bacterium]
MVAIIDGKGIAATVRAEVREAAARLKEERGITPGLAVILVGDDPASRIYVRGKKNACEEAGFLSREFALPGDVPEREVLARIDDLNRDSAIHGILVQFPVPKQIRPDAVIEAIRPEKDVDGLHPYNVGRLFSGRPAHRACTPAGVIELLDRTGIGIEGRHAVIVGRSNLVGKPLALMLLARNATVTLCHTKTREMAGITRQADILVAAAGRPQMIRGDMVREGAVVIDVGINRGADGKLLGDVAFAEVSPKASYITPVPGGVGPMTIAMLLRNTLQAASAA